MVNCIDTRVGIELSSATMPGFYAFCGSKFEVFQKIIMSSFLLYILGDEGELEDVMACYFKFVSPSLFELCKF